MTRLMYLGEMQATDIDGFWLVDGTANMTARSTTIVSIGVPTVARIDGQLLNAGDISVTGQAVTSAGLKWTFNVSAHGNVGEYVIGFALTLANSDVINRFGKLIVKQFL